MDAVTNAADAPQLLDVDMDQLAGTISLVPNNRLLRLKASKPREAVARQDAGHRGRTQAHSSCNLRARVSSFSQAQHFLDPIRVSPSRHPMWPGTAIDQGRLAGLGESPLPLEGRPPRYAGRLGGPGHGHPSQDSMNQKHSTRRGNSGILVKLHLGSSDESAALDTTSLTDLGPDGQQTLPVNNVLRNES
jgi:hypothetical protein